MTRRRGLAAGILSLAALAALASALLAGGTPAEAAPLPALDVSFTFDALQPGLPQTQTADVTVPVAAVISDARWVHFDGIAAETDWVATLCGAGGCLPVAPSSVGKPLPAGTYTLAVQATMRSAQSGSGTMLGHIGLMSSGTGGLAPTGSSVSWMLAVLAGLGAVTGAALFTADRRRSRLRGAGR